MGTFMGHIVPGFFLILVGLRIAYPVIKRMSHLHRKSNHRSAASTGAGAGKHDDAGSRLRLRSSHQDHRSIFRSYPYYNYSSFYPSVCTDAYISLFFTVIGFVGELGTGFKQGHFTEMHNLQHMMMYLAYGTSAWVSVICWNSEAEESNSPPLLPDGSDYASLLLAIVIEGLLFVFHLHGRSMIDVHVHQLLVITIILSLIAGAFEWKNRSTPLAALFRAYTMLVQGTWFWTIAFILYNPMPNASSWDDHDHSQVMMITSLFAGHCIAVFYFLYAMVYVMMGKDRCSSPISDFDEVSYHCIVPADDASDFLTSS